MRDTELTFKIALSMTKGASKDLALRLEERGVSPEDFFNLDMETLEAALQLSKGFRFDKMLRDEALFAARREMERIERHNIRAHFILDEDYPMRLAETDSPPVILYQIGDTDLNTAHVVNLVGTRKPTPYGIEFSRTLVREMSEYFRDLVVVSGLAYGIDASAHNAALDAGIPTVAVVAHGLNMIYPAQHRDLARKIIASGGSIVTEYPFDSTPYRQRFLERNRIIAGLSDVTIVVESDLKGGAMSTANTAFSYSREVAALPGRISDKTSAGCNHLIRKQKASLITCAADILEITGWTPLDMNIDYNQRNLFPELEGDARLVYDSLRYSSEACQVDKIHLDTHIPMARLIACLGEMEFDGIIVRHAGNRYSLT